MIPKMLPSPSGAGLPSMAGWVGPLLALAGLLAAIAATGWHTAMSMVSIWYRSDTFAHAFVVPPIALWLAYRKRGELLVVTPRPMPLALPGLALAMAAWALGVAGNVNALAQAAWVAMIVMAVPLALGCDVARVLMFPLGFLFFCVPIGEFMLPALMRGTADFTVAALRATGIPVYREGLQFSIPSGNWSVVEACSGVRYLIASFMVGTLFAYLNYASMRKRLIFAAVSIAVPIVANWMRAYLIVMIGHLSSNQLGVGVDHLVYGWLFFGLVVTALFALGARWADPPVPAETTPPGATTHPATGYRWWVTALAIALVVAPIAAERLRHGDVPRPTATNLRLPDTLRAGWALAEGSVPDIEPKFGGATARLHRVYALGTRRVGVFLAYYRTQTETSKLVSSTNTVVTSDDPHWNTVEQTPRVLDLAGDGATALRWRIRQVDAAVDRRTVVAWSAYWIDGSLTASDVVAKLRGIWQRLAGRGDDAAVLVLQSASSSADNPEPSIEAFWRANVDELMTALRDARR